MNLDVEGSIAAGDTLDTFEVQPDPEGVRAARAFCVRTLTAAFAAADGTATGPSTDDSVAELLAELVADAEMVTSELVTNAVRAEATRIVVEISQVSTMMRIAVLDDASGEVHSVRPEPLGLNGRGLRIVDTLSARWGVQPWPGAKTVWADLEVPPQYR